MASGSSQVSLKHENGSRVCSRRGSMQLPGFPEAPDCMAENGSRLWAWYALGVVSGGSQVSLSDQARWGSGLVTGGVLPYNPSLCICRAQTEAAASHGVQTSCLETLPTHLTAAAGALFCMFP